MKKSKDTSWFLIYFGSPWMFQVNVCQLDWSTWIITGDLDKRVITFRMRGSGLILQKFYTWHDLNNLLNQNKCPTWCQLGATKYQLIRVHVGPYPVAGPPVGFTCHWNQAATVTWGCGYHKTLQLLVSCIRLFEITDKAVWVIWTSGISSHHKLDIKPQTFSVTTGWKLSIRQSFWHVHHKVQSFVSHADRSLHQGLVSAVIGLLHHTRQPRERHVHAAHRPIWGNAYQVLDLMHFICGSGNYLDKRGQKTWL